MAGHGRLDHRRLAGGFQGAATTQRRLLDFLASNALWIVWGIHTSGWALVALQIALAAMNIRGLKKTEPDAGT